MAKKVKLLLIMLLAFVLSLTAFACTKEEPKNSESSEPTQESVQESAQPEVSTPETSTPETSIPDESTPDESTPDESTPDVSTPDVSSPDEPLDAELITDIPDAGYTVASEVAGSTATAHWFAVYGEQALEFTVYVEDAKIYDKGSVFANDGVLVYIAKAQRVLGYSEDAIAVIVDAKGGVAVRDLALGEIVTDHAVTATATKFTFDEKTVAGYKVVITVPYEQTEITAAEKNASLALGVTNASSVIDVYTSFESEMEIDSANVHTYMALTGDNAFVKSAYIPYGAFWGDAGELTAMSSWNLDGDVEGVNTITMTGSDRDNFIFAHQTGAYDKYYFETKITVEELYKGEAWGKFGIIVFDSEGKEGLFFYVDAPSAGGTGVFNSDAVGLGFNTRMDGGWRGNWAGIGSLGGDSSQYQNGNFVTLGIYRQGALYKLYANGTLIDTVSCGIMGDEEAFVGLACFNMRLTAKDYSLKTEGLEDFEIQKSELDYLFFGDSYIDTNFWYTWESEFGQLNAENIGVGGTKVDYWTARAASNAATYDVKNIITHIGVNDIDSGETAENTIEKLKEMFAAYRLVYPEVNIYYVGLVNNMAFTYEWEDYATVNAAIKALAEEEEYLTFINMAEYIYPENDSTMSWFIADGLHYGVDGYAVLNREICKALDIARVENEGGLGELNVEGAPSWSYSGGWKFEGDGVAHNLGKAESQIFIEGAYGADLYAEVKISVAGINKYDAFPKVGLAIRTKNETYFWAIDCALANNNNGDHFVNRWANVFHRPERLDRDWDWGGEFGQYHYLYDVSYDYDVDQSFKTLAVAKVGSSLYFIADGKVVDCLKGVMGVDEEIGVSVFNFNMEVYAKEGLAITEEAALTEKLNSLKIYKDESMTIDGSMEDWTDGMKTNPVLIPAPGGRLVTVYATLGADGVYLFYDAVVNSYITEAGNWWEATNVEFKLGNEGNQRFASAKATSAPYGFNSRWEDNGQRQVNAAKFVAVDENGKKHIKAEIFVSFACIDGYDANSEMMIAGFAWKTAGEFDNAWAGGDFWYVPEADPGLRTVGITKNGILTGTAKAIDGSLADWEGVEMLTAETDANSGITGKYAWKHEADGLYAIYVFENAAGINLHTNRIIGDWWLNTNLELFDDGAASHWPARLMFFEGQLYHTGNISDAAFTYENNTLIIEFFIAPHLFRVQPTENIFVNVGGWTRGEGGDYWQNVSRGITIAK